MTLDLATKCARLTPIVLKSDPKSPRFVSFGANLAHFWPKSDTHGPKFAKDEINNCPKYVGFYRYVFIISNIFDNKDQMYRR